MKLANLWTFFFSGSSGNSFVYSGRVDAVASVQGSTSFFHQLTEEEGRAVRQAIYPEGLRKPHPRPIVVRVFDSKTGVEIPRTRVNAGYVFRPVETFVYASNVPAREHTIAGTYSVLNVSIYGVVGRVRSRKVQAVAFSEHGKNFAGRMKRRGHRMENLTEFDWRLRAEDLEILQLLGEL